MRREQPWRSVGVCAACATFLALFSAVAPLHAQSSSRILVMPLENTTRDGRIFWMGEASAVLLGDDLTALGAAAITREERTAAFDRLQVPPAAALTDATVIRIGQLVGASRAVVGSLRMDGDALVVEARLLALDAGRVEARATERGPMLDLFAICERVARTLLPGRPRPAGELSRVQPPILAFENYVKGLLAEKPATAIGYLNTAISIAPTFDRASLALWDVYTEQDADDRALAAVQRVPATSIYSRQARFRAGLSQLELKKYDDAFATFKALLDARPTPNVLNNLGVVQLRRGSTPQTGQPTYYFNRAAEIDRSDSDYFFNLGYAYWIDRDAQAAVYWLREAVRRDPADGDAHFVLGAALAASGNGAEAAREKELARRLSSTYAEWEKRPGPDVVPRNLERLKRDVDLPRPRLEESLAASGQRDQRELALFYLDRGRRLYERENDREALTELNRALFLSPYLAEAHLLVGHIHLRDGRYTEAAEALKISIWSAESAEAHAVLADVYLRLKDAAAARTELQRALALDPASPAALRLRDAIDAGPSTEQP